MNNSVTLKNLAQQLDLSISTVSKALNNSSEISEETKKRVKEVASFNNYYPNIFAKGLKLKKTKTLGVVIPTILSNFFSMALEGIEEKATEMGYKITIYISKESLTKEKHAIEKLIQAQVNGVLISPSKETQATNDIEHLKYLNKFGISLVIFDRLLNVINADKVSINDSLEAELATIDLLNLGRKKVSYLSGIGNTSVNEDRKKGYLSILQSLGLPTRIIEIDSNEYPINLINELLENNKIDAIIASDELTTVLTARNIISSGFQIPRDVALIGFTNGKMTETFLPSLSTIDQKAKEQGEIAVHTVIDRIEGRLSVKVLEFILKANIIHRDSTTIPPLSLIFKKILK